jgi:hypothetical protein
MFEGSAHQPRGYFEPLTEAGASLNGSTSVDRTDYWEVVPKEAARLALWMEADRMGWMLPALTPARFETQRGVVINERRENYENKPYGLAQFTVPSRCFRSDTRIRGPRLARSRICTPPASMTRASSLRGTTIPAMRRWWWLVTSAPTKRSPWSRSCSATFPRPGRGADRAAGRQRHRRAASSWSIASSCRVST